MYQENDELILCDYAVAFIDLLGQRDEMLIRHLPEDKEKALDLVKRSVGRVVGTQKHFETYLNSIVSGPTIYQSFPTRLRDALPDMAPPEVKWQRFSDGFVVFVPLGDGMVRSPVNSIYGLLTASGMHCLVGLAGAAPIRAGIDVAWGVEYREGELYGAALCHSYKLESEVAQWPRVVVGDGLISYLKHYATTTGQGMSSQYRKGMADLCLSYIREDRDGVAILDYLGATFREMAGEAIGPDVLRKALGYVKQQLAKWQAEGNEKLERRYRELLSYFERNNTSE